MRCAWNELLSVLPLWMREQIEPYKDQPLQEIRLRNASPPELVVEGKSIWLCRSVCTEDLLFCINTASRYSPWAAATTSQGFLTAPGGHRIGLCGEAIVDGNRLSGIRTPTSLCIRVARDYPGISSSFRCQHRSVLILGAPGWGKTTLLRDLARRISQVHLVSVVDERQELFPKGFLPGRRMDVLSGCPKAQGIEAVLRTMRPEWIAVDEITAESDCIALLHAFGCGIRLLATAHAEGMTDFKRRTIYQPLNEAHVFDTFLILREDKTFYVEDAA